MARRQYQFTPVRNRNLLAVLPCENDITWQDAERIVHRYIINNISEFLDDIPIRWRPRQRGDAWNQRRFQWIENGTDGSVHVNRNFASYAVCDIDIETPALERPSIWRRVEVKSTIRQQNGSLVIHASPRQFRATWVVVVVRERAWRQTPARIKIYKFPGNVWRHHALPL